MRNVPAQPFRGRKRQGQHEDATGVGRPVERGEPCGRRIEESEAGGKQSDRERQQNGERLRLDQEGLADPEQAQDEIAEAEPPADLRSCELGSSVPAPTVMPAQAGIHAR